MRRRELKRRQLLCNWSNWHAVLCCAVPAAQKRIRELTAEKERVSDAQTTDAQQAEVVVILRSTPPLRTRPPRCFCVRGLCTLAAPRPAAFGRLKG